MRVDALYIHPVKSCAPLTVDQSTIEPRGLAWDRRAILVGANGKFVSQREHGKMAQIIPIIENSVLSLKIDNHIYVAAPTNKRIKAQVWRDQVNLALADKEINHALSKFLRQDVKLAFMDDISARHTNPDWADSPTSLADGYPVLVANTASLDDLARIAGIPLTMEQFRPNIVLETNTPWVEDEWAVIQIGDVVLELVKPCSRCVMTTLHPQTGNADFPETMKALIKRRKSGDNRVKGVLFGWNAVVRKSGKLSLGMKAKILQTRPPWPMA